MTSMNLNTFLTKCKETGVHTVGGAELSRIADVVFTPSTVGSARFLACAAAVSWS